MGRAVPSVALLVSVMFLGACQTGSPIPAGPEGEPRVERVLTGYEFTEGPAWDGRGNLYFTDIPNNRIIRYNVAEDRANVFREETGGANGLMFDAMGRLVMCEGSSGRVTRVDPTPSAAAAGSEDGGPATQSGGGNFTVLASHYGASRLNSPNDLVIDEVGGVYFTDPRYGNRENMPMEVEGVYYISAPRPAVRDPGAGRSRGSWMSWCGRTG